MNGYIKFNVWCKEPPMTSTNMQIFVNAGDHRLKQKYNSVCLNPRAMNKYGKLPKIAHESQGMNRAISAFFAQIKPHETAHYTELKPHEGAAVRTRIGDFCMVEGEIYRIKGLRAQFDGLWLVKLDGETAKFWWCGDFFRLRL